MTLCSVPGCKVIGTGNTCAKHRRDADRVHRSSKARGDDTAHRNQQHADRAPKPGLGTSERQW